MNRLSFYRRAVTPYKVQSPKVSSWIKDIFFTDRYYYAYDDIFNLRHHLLADNRSLRVTDLGAGSHFSHSDERTVAEICKNSAITHSKGKVLFNAARYWGAKNILELGTNLGLGSSYLAFSSSECTLTTLEGCPEIAAIAEENFKKLGLNRIQTIQSSFDESLPKLSENYDLVFIDGDHQLESTKKYYRFIYDNLCPNGVLILDDIFWSKEMIQAWQWIQGYKNEGNAYIELNDLGIVCKNVDLKRNLFSLVPFSWKPWQIGLFQ